MTAWIAPLLAAGAHPLAHVNAALNATATVLLVAGYVLIWRRREEAHKRVMLTAFTVSIVFLISYLAYHVWPVGEGATPFPGTGPIRTVYFVILVSHIILAAVVPVLAVMTIYLGFRAFHGTDPLVAGRYRLKHRRLARWTLPIWLYVSVTGVIVYWMLYQL